MKVRAGTYVCVCFGGKVGVRVRIRGFGGNKGEFYI